MHVLHVRDASDARLASLFLTHTEIRTWNKEYRASLLTLSLGGMLVYGPVHGPVFSIG